jgi:soluble lytic murein transglycosylase
MDARQLLADPPERLVQPRRWWRERAILARRALNDGHVSAAYRIASVHGLTEGVEYLEAEWLAGWITLRFLAEPSKARGHFAAVHGAARYPISRARGAYWAGRAAEAAGDVKDARRWYEKASTHPATYYGQLAHGRLPESRNGALPADPYVDPVARAAFRHHPLVRAITLLVRAGLAKQIRPFIRRLDDLGPTPGWRALTAELAQRAGRPDLAVWTAKQAIKDGIGLTRAGYPVLDAAPVPGIEAPLLHALIRQESAFDQRAVSHRGAAGLMQLMPRTARNVAKRISKPYRRDRLLDDKGYNLAIGQAYLRGLLAEFDGSYVLALAAYNAGPHRARRWLKKNGDPRSTEVNAVDWVEMIPFRETRNYVQRVMENLQVYRMRLGRVELAANPENDLRR